jgi:hypothetical protein
VLHVVRVLLQQGLEAGVGASINPRRPGKADSIHNRQEPRIGMEDSIFGPIQYGNLIAVKLDEVSSRRDGLVHGSQ